MSLLIQLLCSQFRFGFRLQMEQELRFGTDQGPKESYKQGLAQQEARSHQLSPWRAGPVTVSAPQIPDEQQGTERMDTASADLTVY